MKTTHRIALEEKPQPKDINAVVQGLMEFNKLHTDGAVPEYLLATVRDDQGALLGGLFGATYLGWLQVQAVWLPDDLRGHGIGTELMAIAEREALRRGCTRVHLETFKHCRSMKNSVTKCLAGWTIFLQAALAMSSPRTFRARPNKGGTNTTVSYNVVLVASI